MGGKLDSLPLLSILSGDSVLDNQWVSRSLLELEPELLVMIRYNNVVNEIDDSLPDLIALNDHSGDRYNFFSINDADFFNGSNSAAPVLNVCCCG